MITPAARCESNRPGNSPPLRGARSGRVFDIKRFSSHDGPGIRSTVFLAGCPLRCGWCHNPEAFALDRLSAADSGLRKVTATDLLAELERDVSYFDASGGGITVSGGEPLSQSAFVFEFLRECRKHDLHTALDSSGEVDSGQLVEAAGLCDLVLYDLKSMDPETHRDWTGVDNRRILENLKVLDALATDVWIRLPLIPGVNDSPENIGRVIEFLSDTRFRRVSILPYHRIADAKYQRLGITNRMAGIAPPTDRAVEEIHARFSAAGFDPHIGF